MAVVSHSGRRHGAKTLLSGSAHHRFKYPDSTELGYQQTQLPFVMCLVYWG